MSEKTKQYSFFQHRACEFFPCHEEIDEAAFNCLFCYCPLYALGKACGGNCRYNEKGNKDCSACDFPHRKENYESVVSRYREIMDVVRAQDANNQV